jgi:hypothetical protein
MSIHFVLILTEDDHTFIRRATVQVLLSRDTLGRKFRGNGGDRGEVLDGVGKRLGSTFYLYMELFGLC